MAIWIANFLDNIQIKRKENNQNCWVKERPIQNERKNKEYLNYDQIFL